MYIGAMWRGGIAEVDLPDGNRGSANGHLRVRSTAVPGVTLVTVDPPEVTLNVVDVAGRSPHNGIELEMLDSYLPSAGKLASARC